MCQVLHTHLSVSQQMVSINMPILQMSKLRLRLVLGLLKVTHMIREVPNPNSTQISNFPFFSYIISDHLFH